MSFHRKSLISILALPALVAGILIPSAVSGTTAAHHQAAHRAVLVAVQAPAPLDEMTVMAAVKITSQRALLARAEAREERAEARAEAWRQHEAVLLAARQRVLTVQAARAHAAAAAATAAVRIATPAVSYAGVYSYAGIEALWLAAGGNPAYEAKAACIGEHESGGRINAVSATADFGVFQIHQDPAALDPRVSALTAVRMSSDGRDWSQWTTNGYSSHQRAPGFPRRVTGALCLTCQGERSSVSRKSPAGIPHQPRSPARPRRGSRR
jgi:hypothetical protein